jgi:hypothetical protein
MASPSLTAKGTDGRADCDEEMDASAYLLVRLHSRNQQDQTGFSQASTCFVSTTLLIRSFAVCITSQSQTYRPEQGQASRWSVE